MLIFNSRKYFIYIITTLKGGNEKFLSYLKLYFPKISLFKINMATVHTYGQNDLSYKYNIHCPNTNILVASHFPPNY